MPIVLITVLCLAGALLLYRFVVAPRVLPAPFLEQRCVPRFPSCCRFDLAWREGGRQASANAYAIDISKTGLRLDVPRRVRPHTRLTLAAPARGLAGTARVRYCRRRGRRFILGLALDGRLVRTA